MKICKNFWIEKYIFIIFRLKELNMLKKDSNLEMNHLKVKDWKEKKKN